ncbi:hypothetical protein, partial [Escherichia coli]|uniref:hypothetical protein n=1 Tax=Escherichia coli TaxID=562 RepID=UPI0025777B06
IRQQHADLQRAHTHVLNTPKERNTEIRNQRQELQTLHARIESEQQESLRRKEEMNKIKALLDEELQASNAWKRTTEESRQELESKEQELEHTRGQLTHLNQGAMDQIRRQEDEIRDLRNQLQEARKAKQV